MKKALTILLLALSSTMLPAADKVAEQIMSDYEDGSAKVDDTLTKLKMRKDALAKAGKTDEANEVADMIASIAPGGKEYAEAVNSNREPVPAEDAIKTARAALHDTFKDEFSKKKDEDKMAFSKSLREMAATEKNTVQKYALFVEAISLASDAENMDEAFVAVTEMCAVFQADPSKEKGLILAKFAKKASKPEDFKNLVEKYLSMVTMRWQIPTAPQPQRC